MGDVLQPIGRTDIGQRAPHQRHGMLAVSAETAKSRLHFFHRDIARAANLLIGLSEC